jgi:hypothetical protein
VNQCLASGSDPSRFLKSAHADLLQMLTAAPGTELTSAGGVAMSVIGALQVCHNVCCMSGFGAELTLDRIYEYTP